MNDGVVVVSEEVGKLVVLWRYCLYRSVKTVKKPRPVTALFTGFRSFITQPTHARIQIRVHWFRYLKLFILWIRHQYQSFTQYHFQIQQLLIFPWKTLPVLLACIIQKEDPEIVFDKRYWPKIQSWCTLHFRILNWEKITCAPSTSDKLRSLSYQKLLPESFLPMFPMKVIAFF